MVGEHLGPVLGTLCRQRLDPLGCAEVELGPPRARDLAVRDVADEDVPERVLHLAGHRSAPLAPDQLLALERMQHLLGLPPRRVADRGDGTEPEDLPDHGGLVEERLLDG